MSVQTTIGEVAGRLWHLLEERGETEATRLPHLVGESTLITYQALGWLAREDNIRYRLVGAKTYVTHA